MYNNVYACEYEVHVSSSRSINSTVHIMRQNNQNFTREFFKLNTKEVHTLRAVVAKYKIILYGFKL